MRLSSEESAGSFHVNRSFSVAMNKKTKLFIIIGVMFCLIVGVLSWKVITEGYEEAKSQGARIGKHSGHPM